MRAIVMSGPGARLVADVAAGRPRVPVCRTYALAEVPTAFGEFTGGTHPGPLGDPSP